MAMKIFKLMKCQLRRDEAWMFRWLWSIWSMFLLRGSLSLCRWWYWSAPLWYCHHVGFVAHYPLGQGFDLVGFIAVGIVYLVAKAKCYGNEWKHDHPAVCLAVAVVKKSIGRYHKGDEPHQQLANGSHLHSHLPLSHSSCQLHSGWHLKMYEVKGKSSVAFWEIYLLSMYSGLC